MTQAGPPAHVAETHSAVVLLLGDRAYKIKKPVRLDFLDFSTPDRRGAVLRRELELNRRLAPDVYLEVADVLGADGAPCEHVLVMRRMPDERRLSTLVAAGAPVDDALRDVARLVAAFHARAERGPAIAAAGRAPALAAKLAADLDELAGLAGPPAALLPDDEVAAVSALARRYVAGRGPLLEERAAAGLVCDGHGDLLADDIFCLDDGPRVLDCIEFDDRLRFVDVLADVAFLAMDLERLGAPEAAARFLDTYAELSGEHHPATLIDFYVGWRALIRAKVAGVRARQGDASAAGDARRLLTLARGHFERARVVLVLVGGAPGTGKSTLANGLGDRLGWAVLRSDEVRKDLAGGAHTERVDAPYRSGMYDEATTAVTYGALVDRAGIALERGQPVVLDASFTVATWREEAARVAAATSSDLVELRCDAPRDVARRRVAARRVAGGDASDATALVADALREAADPWPSAVTIDTTAAPERTLAVALAALDRDVRP